MLPEVTASPTRVINEELNFLKHGFPKMAQLVNGEIQLARWIPVDGGPYSEHIRRLGIPERRLNNGLGGSLPNLLLHDLGSLAGSSASISTTLSSLFESGCDWLLVNTSGSGKTRLLLEGLCVHWGLYFTCADDPSVGSKDLFNAIHKSLPEEGLVEPIDLDDRASITRNRDIAAQKLSEVLLSRLIILYYFLSVAQDVVGDHKKRWLYLQLQPYLILGGSSSASGQVDIFDACRDRLSRRKLSYKQLKEATHKLLHDISLAIGGKINLVIDEAQSAVEAHPLAFISRSGMVRRPVLGELVAIWATLLADTSVNGLAAQYLISGTGVYDGLMEEALSSGTPFKQRVMCRSWAFTGDFDTEEAQRDYVHKFLPPSLTGSVDGRALINRIHFWLRGRHRFTAQFMALLLQNGFRNPHILLNRYVEAIGGFQPTDFRVSPEKERFRRDNSADNAQNDVSNQTILSEFQPLKFEEILKHGESTTKLRAWSQDYHSHANKYPRVLNEEWLYVRYGIARFQTHENVVTFTEPLVVFACSTWLNKVEPEEHNYTFRKEPVFSVTYYEL